MYVGSGKRNFLNPAVNLTAGMPERPNGIEFGKVLDVLTQVWKKSNEVQKADEVLMSHLLA